jgi:formylglycine-generating enzyme required for sulfatase activity
MAGFVQAAFANRTTDTRAAERAAQRFLTVVQERTGLLVEAGQGVYRFSHLTFQEYLTAVEVAEREDYIAYTLAHAAEPFWREVILLEAGYISTKNQARTTRLIRAITDAPREPELFHNLVLAAECMRDVGATRVEGDLATALVERLRQELARPVPEAPTGVLAGMLGRLTGTTERRQAIVRRRIAAVTALNRIETGSFGRGRPHWSLPHGEPQWVMVPAGEFWMGSDSNDQEAIYDGKPVHRLFLPAFQIARTPVTNAQYAIYVQATGVEPPRGWEDGQPPKEKLEHPVVWVSWHDACGYCTWLSRLIRKQVRLPTEAEWEKAARGDRDKRPYPWGEAFDMVKCNSAALGLDDTTPVGVFPAGASPYGCLDMAGNVLEWTCSLWGGYPYNPHDGRENLDAPDDASRVLRGGAFWDDPQDVRCAYRVNDDARVVYDLVGFRVALAGPP